jgi:hypothetical protein
MIATVWIGEDLLELLERLDPKNAELTTAVEEKNRGVA